MRSVLSVFQRCAFWIVSRSAGFVYGRLPFLGRLQGVMVVIESPPRFLVIERNDGLGFGLPGGMVSRGEDPIDALRREVLEETGLTLLSCEELFRCDSDFRFPTKSIVYVGRAECTLRRSWEGEPKWLTLAEIEAKTFPPVKPVVAYLLKRSHPSSGTADMFDRGIARPAMSQSSAHEVAVDLHKAIPPASQITE